MTPQYRADIDGLRAVAVLSVLLFHLGIEPFSGGYLGVDVFFVISGYLITIIITKETDRKNFSFTAFYVRRFKRLLPALTVVIVFCLVSGFILLDPNSLVELGNSVIASSLFSSNLFFYYQSGYFDGPADLKPLLHTWSLAVEEQYYIIYPALLVLIAKYGAKRYRQWLVLLGLLSFVIGVQWPKSDPSAAFYLMPSRAWELFIGSVLAVVTLPKLKNQILLEVLSLSGLLFIVSAMVFFTSETIIPGFAALLPTIGAALIIYSGGCGVTVVNRGLSSQPLVFIGLISYSLYLWHWPIIVYVKYYTITELANEQIVMICALSFMLAILTWKFIEKPFRRGKQTEKNTKVMALSGGVLTILLCGGLFLVVNDGFKNRYSDVMQMGNDADWEYWSTCQNFQHRINSKTMQPCSIGGEHQTVNKTGEPSFIFWGDSHAKAMATGLDLSAKAAGERGVVAFQPACPPLLSIERMGRRECEKFNQLVIAYIEQSPNIKTVIINARWALSFSGTRYKLEQGKSVRLVDLLSESAIEKNNQQLFKLGLYRTIRKLKSMGRRVVVVGPIPEVGYSVPAAQFIASRTGRDVNKIIAPTREEFIQRAKGVKEVLAEVKNNFGVQILDPSILLCDHEKCNVVFEKNILYRDDDHLSVFGSNYISAMFDEVFVGAGTF